jgi:hypothetical protein
MTDQSNGDAMTELQEFVTRLGEPAGVYAALARAQGRFPTISKTKTATVETRSGGSYSYNYADIADVLAAVRPILADEGLAIVQRTDVLALGGHVLVTTLYHADGSFLESQWRMRDLADPQGVGGDLTYFRRYQLSALIGVATEDDDDNARSKRRASGDDYGGGEEPQPQRRPTKASTVEQRQGARARIAMFGESMKPVIADWMRAQGIFLNRTSVTVQQLTELHRYLNTLEQTEPFPTIANEPATEGEGSDETQGTDDDAEPDAEPEAEPDATEGPGADDDWWANLDDTDIGAEVASMNSAQVNEWLGYFGQPITGAVGARKASLIVAWMEARDERAAAFGDDDDGID